MRISEARKRRQLNPQELYQINWFLGIALAILSVGSVLYLAYEVGVHLLLGGFLLSVALVRPQLTALVPRFVWHLIPFLLVILLAFDLHQTGQPVPALIRLNLFLVVYRALAFRKKREDLQLV